MTPERRFPKRHPSHRRLGRRPPRTYAPMTNTRETKIFYARLLLVVAFAVGLLSAFQDWELVHADRLGQAAICRNFNTVRRILSWGLLSEYQERFLVSHSWISLYKCSAILCYVLISITFLILLASFFLASFLSYSRILWWLWMFSHVTWHVFMTYIYQKHAPYFHITGIGAGYLDSQPHISWLSGFYFGCAALFLHLCAMLLLFFPLRKKPAM